MPEPRLPRLERRVDDPTTWDARDPRTLASEDGINRWAEAIEQVEDELDARALLEKGDPGEKGEPGEKGDSGGFFRFVQDVPASTWTIIHDLPFYPAVTVVDSAGSTVEGAVEYLSPDTISVTFSAPFAGTANLS